MALAGLYRRLLPSPPAIEFASNEGKQLFREAFENGTMEGFFKLISYYQTQSEPAFCGLASLSMVLNALAIDPRRKWKGPWRWFDDSMLECCEPLEKIKATGITLGKVVCLAHCAGAKVEAYRTDQSHINDFRKYVTRCSASSDCHLIASYHRATFKQTGNGHFSPIGGYHAERDMVLILDVARFKYPPHWVPLPLLWEAMDYVDETTNQKRGFMLVSRPHRNAALLYTLSCKHESWVHVAKYLMDEIPLLLASKDVIDLQSVLSIVIMSHPSNFGEFVKWIAEVRRQEDGGQGISQEEKARINIKEEILKLVQETALFKHVSAFLSNSCHGKMVNLGTGNTLPSIAAHVCCQGAELLGGKSNSSGGYCCEDTCVKCLESNDNRPVTVVSGTVVNGNNGQGVDVLVPSSLRKLCGLHSSSHDNMSIHPASEDILTVLLLSLPKETWAGIKEKKLLQEMYDLVSTENLPTLLQEEVLHLRRQLHLLKRCLDNKMDDELGAPLC